ncbi:hypothetical protein Bca101_018767 [Brassica carinata]
MHGGEVSSIKGPGRSSSTVERFREARNVRCGGEFMGVDMLLLDSQTTMMAATVNVNQLATHMPNMKAGSLCRLVAQDTGLARAAPLLRGHAKVESLRIAELNDFVITAPSQACQPE